MRTAELAELVKARAAGSDRFMLGIAGPPGSGKSTLADELARKIGPGASVVPMDGFHFDDGLLEKRGLRQRKGAPETFDVGGLIHLLTRLRSGEDQIAIPIFDRSLEIARTGADVVTLDKRILIVEGNYLLLNETPWTTVGSQLDLAIYLDVPKEVLIRRLTDRWAGYGKAPGEIETWLATNDLPNIDRVITGSRTADFTMRQ